MIRIWNFLNSAFNLISQVEKTAIAINSAMSGSCKTVTQKNSWKPILTLSRGRKSFETTLDFIKIAYEKEQEKVAYILWVTEIRFALPGKQLKSITFYQSKNCRLIAKHTMCWWQYPNCVQNAR